MAALRVPLRLSRTPEGNVPWAVVRELTGADELAVEGIGTRAALTLLGRLITFDAPASVASLSASDRDLLLAALYRLTYGERIQSTIRCVQCHENFDLEFPLSDLTRHLAMTQRQAIASIRVDAVVTLQDGSAVRVPDATDELSAADLPRASAIGRLQQAAISGADTSAESLASLLERVAPLLDLELDARCAECGHVQQVSFDLQSFLLRRLIGDQKQLHADVHALAASYGWSLHEILGLSRRQRRDFVATLDEANRRSVDARRRSMR